MRAELKYLHSPDVFDLESHVPDSERFVILIQAMFGAEGEEGYESFDILVCSADWIAGEAREKGIVDGRHMLIVPRYDYNAIRAYIIAYGDSCRGESWDEIATRLSRLGHWEFEDYQEYDPGLDEEQ